MDYLMGASECETAKNEEIHKRIGLSNKAIKNSFVCNAKSRPITFWP